MHTKILSEREERIIKKFLNNGEKLEGFNLLRSRAKKVFQRIQRDYELLKAFLEKASEE